MLINHSCDSHEKSPTIETDFLQLTVTAESRIEAETLIRQLTTNHLVACAQVQGPKFDALNHEPIAWRCRFKTSKKLLPKVYTAMEQFFSNRNHTIQTLPIVKGSHHFLTWLKNTLDTE